MTYLKAIPWSLLAVLAITGGCGAGHVNIGDEQDAQVKSGIDAFVGNWDGYVEAYTFLDGTDQVRITINSDGTAKIRFGEQDLWPLPTDPNADFLPRLDGYDYTKVAAEPLVGFNYTLKDVKFDEQRISARAWTNEAYDHWCSIQTPNLNLADFNSGYRCGPDTFNCSGIGARLNAGLQSDACYVFDACPDLEFDLQVAHKQVSCDQLYLCGVYAFCSCDVNACSLKVQSRTNNMSVDATLEDNQHSLVGTLVLPSGSNPPANLTIRLKRQ